MALSLTIICNEMPQTVILSVTILLLEPLQLAYRGNHSADDAVTLILHCQSPYAKVVFVYFSSAFNIAAKWLHRKLLQLNVDPLLLPVDCWLSKRQETFCVPETLTVRTPIHQCQHHWLYKKNFKKRMARACSLPFYKNIYPKYLCHDVKFADRIWAIGTFSFFVAL